MEVSAAKRLKELEGENSKLKRLLAETMLDNAALKERVSKKWSRPLPVAGVQSTGCRSTWPVSGGRVDEWAQAARCCAISLVPGTMER